MKRNRKIPLLAAALSMSFLFPPAICSAATANDVMKEVSTLKKDNPQEAITKLQQYIAANPTENPVQLSLMEIAISQIYADQLKQPDQAIAAIDSGLARSAEPGSYFRLASTKCYLLASSRRYKEANDYFHEVLPKYLEQPPGVISSSLSLLLQYYFTYIIRNAGKTEDYISVFRAVFQKQPQLFAYPRMTPMFIETLMVQPGQEAEALSWAKLYWMTCSFDEKTVNDATALLQKAWIAKEMNSVKGTNFLKALQDSEAPNPLKAVPLPPLDTAKLKEVQKSLAADQRILIHIMLNEHGEAMLAARRLLLDDPSRKGNVAALEMARIFKAADLNMVRANALLQYMQTGEGANPVDEFFKQHPVGVAANG